LPDDSLETIERVISFLYLQNYEEQGHIVELSDISKSEKPSNDCRSPLLLAVGNESEGLDWPNPENSFDDGDATGNCAYDNLQVYPAADKFGIFPLKSLAAERFASRMNRMTPEELAGFPKIARKVMASTSPHDYGLRSIVADTIAKNLHVLVKQDIIRVIDDFPGLGSAVLVKLVESGRMVNDEQESVLAQIAQKFNKYRTCRYCSIHLNVLMENGECQQGTFRCASCRTRH
jgi:hypothetical protein